MRLWEAASVTPEMVIVWALVVTVSLPLPPDAVVQPMASPALGAVQPAGTAMVTVPLLIPPVAAV